jgi:DNA-binding transcriptional LysR family regulator
MELRHLRYFVAVGQTLNFSRAAEMLHLSQPPLSRQIQEFEEEVGAALFDRNGRKTRLTEAGEYLLVESERLLAAIEAACRTAKSISQKTRSLKVGCVSSFLNTRAGPFLEELGKLRPEMKLEILVMHTESQEKALMACSLDIGIVRPWIREGILSIEPIAEECFCLVFPESRRLKGDARACFSALASQTFIGIAPSLAPGLSEAISKVFEEYSLAPAHAYECNDAFSIVGLVASGLGWSILPEFAFHDAKIAGVQSIRLEQKNVISLCYREKELSAQAKEFITLAKQYFSRA